MGRVFCTPHETLVFIILQNVFCPGQTQTRYIRKTLLVAESRFFVPDKRIRPATRVFYGISIWPFVIGRKKISLCVSGYSVHPVWFHEFLRPSFAGRGWRGVPREFPQPASCDLATFPRPAGSRHACFRLDFRLGVVSSVWFAQEGLL